MQKITWIYTARGIGIISVVSGHVFMAYGELYENAVWAIYLFHMPLFFVLAGYVQKQEEISLFMKKKSRSLLIPYISYIVIISPLFIGKALYVTMAKHGAWDYNFLDLLWGGQRLKGALGTVWFISCLFIAQFIFNALLQAFKSPKSPLMVMAVGGLVLIGTGLGALHIDSPLNMAVAPIAVGFIWAGNLLHDLTFKISWALAAGAVSVILLLLLISVDLPTEIDMKQLQYGTPIVSVFIAIGLSMVTIAVSILLDATPAGIVFRYLGEASLTIMFAHQFFHQIFRGLIANYPLLLIALSIIGSLAVHEAIKWAGHPWTVLFLGAPKVRAQATA